MSRKNRKNFGLKENPTAVKKEVDENIDDLLESLFSSPSEEGIYKQINEELSSLVADQTEKRTHDRVPVFDEDKLEDSIQVFGLKKFGQSRRSKMSSSEITSYKEVAKCTQALANNILLLKAEFPNFARVIEDLACNIRLRAISEKQLSVPALNLDGPPGIGKTTFARALAAALGVDFFDISIASKLSKFELCGSKSGWTNAQCGELAKIMIGQTNHYQPVILLDDLCSASINTDHQHNVVPVLLSILEPKQAKHFIDQYYGVEIDLSGVIFISTTNHFSQLPESIQSRLNNYDIPLPSGSQTSTVVQNIYKAVLDEYGLSAHFADALAPTVIGYLNNINLRQVERLITHSISSAYLRCSKDGGVSKPIAVRVSDLNLNDINHEVQSMVEGAEPVLH